MKEISFTGLGLELKINSIAINIFGIDIYWYSIFIVLAFILALVFIKKDTGKYGINFEDILEMFVIIIPISIICARIYFVIFKLEDYIQNPIEIFNIRNGGLAIYGGIIGAVILIIVYCKKEKIKVLNMLDYIVPYLALRTGNRKMGKFF